MVAVACAGCATASTGNVDNVTGTTARVLGHAISSTDGQLEFWAQYGPTDSYGSETPHNSFPTDANTSREVFGELSALKRTTTYHYRICAQDSQQSGGPGCGADKTLTTTNLECGDVITHDFTLSGSMTCDKSYATPGLVIGADGVDINLNGAFLNGPLYIFFDSSTPTGIDNSGGYDDVTIRNGSLSRWGQSVELKGGSFNTIRNVDMEPSHAGVDIEGGESNTIRSSEMRGSRFGSGLSATGSDALVVADSSGTRWSVDSEGARLVRNEVAEGFSDFGTCLFVRGNGNRIEGNRVFGCPDGSLVVGAGSNAAVIGNEVSGATTGTAGDPDGIRVEAFTAGVLLQGNYSHDNDDDGIDVRGTATRLQGNRADNNGDFGIDAVAGVTDLGGNTAAGNGNPLQCRNVFCP